MGNRFYCNFRKTKNITYYKRLSYGVLDKKRREKKIKVLKYGYD